MEKEHGESQDFIDPTKKENKGMRIKSDKKIKEMEIKNEELSKRLKDSYDPWKPKEETSEKDVESK